MNIVIKMVEALPEGGEWTPVVKLSDEKGKYTGEEKMIHLAKTICILQSNMQGGIIIYLKFEKIILWTLITLRK
jgi:hypothetical protein